MYRDIEFPTIYAELKEAKKRLEEDDKATSQQIKEVTDNIATVVVVALAEEVFIKERFDTHLDASSDKLIADLAEFHEDVKVKLDSVRELLKSTADG